MATQLTAPSTFSAGQTAGVSANLNTMVNDLTYLAGATVGRKNALHNSIGFPVNQRAAASVSATGYGVDRWLFILGSGATSVVTPTTPSPGTTSGYIKQYLAWTRTVAGSTSTTIEQRIESVSTFAGQTATVSILMSCASGTVDINPVLTQSFGSGGSPSGAVNTVGSTLTATTTPTLYTYTFTVPSISGKTLGTTAGTDYLSLVLSRPTSGNGPTVALNIFTVQLELGSAFTGWEYVDQQQNLSMCQRYFWRRPWTVANEFVAPGFWLTTSNIQSILTFPTTMRAVPTPAIGGVAASWANYAAAAGVLACSSLPTASNATPRDVSLSSTSAASGVLGQGGLLLGATSAATIDFTADL